METVETFDALLATLLPTLRTLVERLVPDNKPEPDENP